MIENIIPVLGVSNLKKSVEFYLTKLSFQLRWGDPKTDRICSICRDDHYIMLQLQNPVKPSLIYLGLTNDELFNKCLKNNGKIVQPPTENTWAYEMQILDIDSNTIWMGTSPKNLEI